MKLTFGDSHEHRGDGAPYLLSELLVSEIAELAARHGKTLIVEPNPSNPLAGPVYRLVDVEQRNGVDVEQRDGNRAS